MESEKLSIYDRSERKLIERVHYHVVDFLVVLVDALLSKVVGRGHLSALVIASEQEYQIRIGDFKGEQGQNYLDSVVSSVHIVAQKQVLCHFGVAAEPEYLAHVVKLAVNVTDYGNRVL